MKPLDQVDQPPANDAMDRRDRTALDRFDKRSALGIIEQRLSSRGLAIERLFQYYETRLTNLELNILCSNRLEPLSCRLTMMATAAAANCSSGCAIVVI